MHTRKEFFVESFSNVLHNHNWIGKIMLVKYWIFDMLSKTNGSLNQIKYFPSSFDSIVTLPLVSNQGDGVSKLKFLIYSLWVVKLFTFQSSFIWKKLLLQQQQKKSSCYILQSKVGKHLSNNRLFYYLFTIIPYLWISYGYDRLIVLSDPQGNINLSISELTCFTTFVDEKLSTWDRQILITFNWVWANNVPLFGNKLFFVGLPFIRNLLNWILWSSFSMTCGWGHGGWLSFSKFSKAAVYANKIFFSKNFKF